MYSSEIGARQAATPPIATDSVNLKSSAPGVGAKSGVTGTPAPVPGDQTNLSAAGTQMAGQATAATGESDVRTEKVAALRLSIQNGSYNVPAAKVADKLIEGMGGVADDTGCAVGDVTRAHSGGAFASGRDCVASSGAGGGQLDADGLEEWPG